MDILLIAATPPETEMLRSALELPLGKVGETIAVSSGSAHIELLHTGIGMVNTTYHLARKFMGAHPQLAIQFGIGGAFENGPEVGEVVEILAETFAELGAESPGEFLDLKTMGFSNFEVGNQVFYNEMENPRQYSNGLRKCRGITVNKVHGKADSIAEIQQLWNPEVESMEGAAFFQCCLMNNIPFAQYRGISNLVESRNREAWEIPQAIKAVNEFVLSHIRQFS